MNPYPLISDLDRSLFEHFQKAGSQPLAIIDPLREASTDSSSIVLGYGRSQEAIRSEMVPYFHVCGGTGEAVAVRALIVAGWLGTESTATLAAARLVAALETRPETRRLTEVTVYPVANVEAARAARALTSKQELEGVQLWQSSPCSHIQVLESELTRYAYDVVVLIRETPKPAKQQPRSGQDPARASPKPPMPACTHLYLHGPPSRGA